MKTQVKNSKQAKLDKENVAVLQSDSSTGREKDRAFNELYARHNKQFHLHLVRNLHDSDLADDLLVISFQKIFDNINSFDLSKGNAVSTWMYKILNNTMIDATRKKTIEVLSLDKLTGKTSEDNDGMDFQIDSGVDNPEQEMIRQQVIAEIRGIIEGLKEGKVKDAMICRYLKEMSFPEMAEELGLPNNSTLRTTVDRGKKILEKKLAHLKFQLN